MYIRLVFGGLPDDYSISIIGESKMSTRPSNLR